MVVSSSSLPRAKQSCLLVAGGLATREQSISLQVKQLFLLHPTDPSSLPAQYGTEMPFNAVHGSRDRMPTESWPCPSPASSSDKDMEAPQD